MMRGSSLVRMGWKTSATTGAAAMAMYGFATRDAHTEPGARKTFCMDPFGARQFDLTNTKVSCNINYNPEKFTAIVEESYEKKPVLVDGYAPFCKHLFVPNFVGAKVGYMEITPENEHKLKTAYEARKSMGTCASVFFKYVLFLCSRGGTSMEPHTRTRACTHTYTHMHTHMCHTHTHQEQRGSWRSCRASSPGKTSRRQKPSSST